jgi:16S rRNA U516 pseudouridylate synthase RsuA-like enzyme
MSKWVKAITSVLTELGPMTRNEIEAVIPEGKVSISSVLSRMNTKSPQSGKRIYIKAYVYDAIDLKRYPRAVYAIGDKKDAVKPKSNPNENRKRYIKKKVTQYTMNNVFNLGIPHRKIRKEMRLAA